MGEKNMDTKTDDNAGKCPVNHGTRGHRNRDWWPEHLDIGVLHARHPPPIRWARASTTPRNSRASTSMP